jgi:hypothetical protein
MPGRRGFGSQAFDQPLDQAEQGEDRHGQHDEQHYEHAVSYVYGLPDFDGPRQGTPSSQRRTHR